LFHPKSKTMRKNIFLIVIISSINVLFAQSTDNLISIKSGNRNEVINVNEFKRVYLKNNSVSADSRKSIKEYLDLYVNFRLKVNEAIAQGYDTMPEFKKEYQGYRAHLAKPYLTSESYKEILMKEAYEFMQWDVNVSHIMIQVAFDKATPKDTLEAYKKTLDIYNRVKKGEDFGKLAAEFSNDPSSNTKNGELGWFTAFKFPYSFEKVAFSLKIGELSKPVRTSFGYHILRLNDKRKAFGEIQVAHIIKLLPQDAEKEQSDSIKNLMQSIYSNLQTGASFDSIVKEVSDDRSTADKGGELPWFGTGRMIPEFEDICFTLKQNGDYSQPFQTFYGWHIVKRLNAKPLSSYDFLKTDLESRVTRQERLSEINNYFINQLKKEYSFQLIDPSINVFYKLDTSYFRGNFAIENLGNLNLPLMKFNGFLYLQSDFAKYLDSRKNENLYGEYPTTVFVNKILTSFIESKLLEFEDLQLEKKYEKFRLLSEEYHDGILLFNIMDAKVWSKAVKDSAGLEKFYELNKENYKWDNRLNASLFYYTNTKMEKEIKKMLAKKIASEEIAKTINNKFNAAGDTIYIKEEKYSKGDNPITDSIEWKTGIFVKSLGTNNLILINIKEVLSPEPKLLSEARGQIISDYQDFLEKEWLNELHSTYSITVDRELFEKLSNEIQ